MGRALHDQGSALLAAVLMIGLVSALGLVSLKLAASELQLAHVAQDEAAALHLAEAGLEALMTGFASPQHGTTSIGQGLLGKRYDLPEAGSSFFDSQGRSQFSGTRASPDVLYDARRGEDVDWLRTLGTGHGPVAEQGRIEMVKVYGPQQPGLLCTVEAIAEVRHMRRTVAVQLGAVSVPPLRAAVQTGRLLLGPSPAPVWVHWGDMKIAGPAWFTSPRDLPVRTALAPVGIESYADVRTAEDRWITIWIGGETRFAGPVPADWTPPLNVHASLNPVPGLQLDLWLYGVLKKYAQLFGKYYRPGPDGLLYLNGVIEPGLGRTASDVFASREVGQSYGLVFIDTPDGQPPRTDNMATLTVETDYTEGIFMVNGHLRLVPHGSG